MIKRNSGSNTSKRTSKSIEQSLISKLVETRDFKLVQDRQITSKFFSGEHQKVFRYIERYYADNKEVPTPRVLKKKFRTYELETYDNGSREVYGTEEPLTYWLNEVREKHRHNTLASYVEDMAEKLEGGDSSSAFKVMKKALVTVETDIEITSTVDLKDTSRSEKRKELYRTRKENKGIVGIPTGFPLLDHILKGLQDDTLTTCIAKSGVGKTWLEVLIGSHVMLAGYDVTQFVTEMSIPQMEDRYEAALFAYTVGDFNYERFKSGGLYPEEEEAYFDFLDNILPSISGNLHIEDATSVTGILATLNVYSETDLILVDGAYLMADDQGAESDWLRVAHITRDLKKHVAKGLHKPVFINSQADKNTSTKTGPELDNISFSQAVGQDSDNVLGLHQDAQMKVDREMKIKVNKNREGTLGNILINWDFTRMNFDPIFMEKEEESNIDSKSFIDTMDLDEDDE